MVSVRRFGEVWAVLLVIARLLVVIASPDPVRTRQSGSREMRLPRCPDTSGPLAETGGG